MIERYRNQVRQLLRELPGVRWKLINIEKMDKQKHQEMGEKLEGVLTRDN